MLLKANLIFTNLTANIDLQVLKISWHVLFSPSSPSSILGSPALLSFFLSCACSWCVNGLKISHYKVCFLFTVNHNTITESPSIFLFAICKSFSLLDRKLPSFIATKEIMAITFQQLFFITFSPLNLSRNYAYKTPANCWWFIATLFWLQKRCSKQSYCQRLISCAILLRRKTRR